MESWRLEKAGAPRPQLPNFPASFPATLHCQFEYAELLPSPVPGYSHRAIHSSQQLHRACRVRLVVIRHGPHHRSSRLAPSAFEILFIRRYWLLPYQWLVLVCETKSLPRKDHLDTPPQLNCLHLHRSITLLSNLNRVDHSLPEQRYRCYTNSPSTPGGILRDKAYQHPMASVSSGSKRLQSATRRKKRDR